MPRRIIQYEDVCKVGLTGAILHGDFLYEGGDGGNNATDEYLRNSWIATLIMNAPTVLCNPETGKIEEFQPDKLQSFYKSQYQMPSLLSGETKVFKVHIPKIYDTNTFSGIIVPEVFWWDGPENYNLTITCYDNPQLTGQNLVTDANNPIEKAIGNSLYVKVRNPTPFDYHQSNPIISLMTFQVMFSIPVNLDWLE